MRIVQRIKIPPVPSEMKSDLKEPQNQIPHNMAKLDTLIQNSEKLIKYSENVIKNLEDLNKILLSKRENASVGKLGNYSNNKPLQKIDENIPTEDRKDEAITRVVIPNVKREADLEDEENISNVPKRPRLRIGISKRRSRLGQ